jgi:hypothetical protein
MSKKKEKIDVINGYTSKLPIIDEAALSAQLSKKETLNSVVVDGVEQIRNGKIPGPAMIKFLTLLKIIK